MTKRQVNELNKKADIVVVNCSFSLLLRSPLFFPTFLSFLPFPLSFAFLVLCFVLPIALRLILCFCSFDGPSLPFPQFQQKLSKNVRSECDCSFSLPTLKKDFPLRRNVPRPNYSKGHPNSLVFFTSFVLHPTERKISSWPKGKIGKKTFLVGNWMVRTGSRVKRRKNGGEERRRREREE